MVTPRFADGGAPIPMVPGASGPRMSGPAPSNPVMDGHPTTRRYATGYLQNLASTRRQDTLAFLQSGGKAGEGWVYSGHAVSDSPLSGHPSQGQTRTHTVIEHQDAITSRMTEFEYMSKEKKQTLAKQLFMAGFLSKPDANLMDLQDAYANLLSSAAARYAQGQQVTPEQLLDRNIRYNLAAAGVDAGGKYSDKNTNKWFQRLLGAGDKTDLAKSAGAAAKRAPEVDLSGTYVTKNKSVDIWSPEDAQGLIRSVLRRELDRDPTQAEFEEFVSTLQAKQKANPAVTTTTQTTDKTGRVTGNTSVTRGGLTSQGIEEIATRDAQSKPGWAEWQAMGTYFPALMDALGSAVPGA